MNEQNDKTPEGDVLDHNVEQLLSRASDPPQISDAARSKILGELKTSTEPLRHAHRRRTIRRAVVGTGAFAAAAAAAVILFVYSSGERENALQRHLNPGPGPMAIELTDGTELLLNAGAEFVVEGERQVRLIRGEALFDVAHLEEQGDGERSFIVDVPQGRAVVLGTRFMLSAQPDETQAAVARGRVRLENEFGEATLGAGEAGVLSERERPTRRPAPRLSHLVSWANIEDERLDEPQAVRQGTLLARVPTSQEREFPLPLRELNVDVHIEDQVARVAIDQTFFNPMNQQLEGVYSFPLGPGAAISRLAMYVNGELMEAGCVERQEAREIYESIVYQRRDPALLEWMEGNRFKIRIFPLEARREKRILLSYTQSLERLYDDYRLEVPLPELDGAVDRVRFRVRLNDCPSCEVRSTSHEISVARDGDDQLLSFDAQRHSVGRDLLLLVRDPAEQARAFSYETNEERYVQARIQPVLEHSDALSRRPRRWVILDDTSASRTPIDLRAQSFLIRSLIEELDDDDEVAILTFDTDARPLGEGFAGVRRVDMSVLGEQLDEGARHGVGTTDLGRAFTAALELLGRADSTTHQPTILYLGDGVITDGERDLETLSAQLRGRAMVVAVAVGDTMDSSALRSLSETTGGLFTSMNPGDDLAWRAFDLVATLNTPRVVDLTVNLLDATGRGIEGMQAYPSSRQLAHGEEVDIVAMSDRSLSPPPPAAARLSGTLDGQPWSETFVLPTADSEAGYLPRLWARRRVDALVLDDAAAHRAEIAALGVRHFLMTPHTSLLVLENDAMYEQYGVRRDRSDDWAHYTTPAQIPVVRETASAGTDVAIDAVLLRSPVRIFAEDLPTRTTGRIIRGLSRLGSPSTGTLDDLLAGSLGASGRLEALFGSIETGPRSTTAQETRFQKRMVVSTEELTMGEREWSRADEGRRFGAERNVTRSWFRSQNVMTTRDLAKRRRRTIPIIRMSKGGGFRAGIDVHQIVDRAPRPIRLAQATDQRLDDLTTFVHGLFNGELDGRCEELRVRSVGHDSGSITAAAREIVREARQIVTGRQYSFADGASLAVGADGSLVLDQGQSQLPTERIRWSGGRVVSIYPDLGLAVERQLQGFEPAVLATYAPFVLPDAESLSRWYHVTTVGEGTIRLRHLNDEEPSVELELDESSRVIALRRLVDDHWVTELGFEHGEGELTIISDSERASVRVERIGRTQPEALPETVVHMPLRRPTAWTEQLSRTQPGSAEWRVLQRQRLASYAALGQRAEITMVLRELVEQVAPLTVGELVLGSGADLDIEEAGRIIEGQRNHAVARYIVASRALASGREGELTALAREASGSLVGMLSSYRGVLEAVGQRDRALSLYRQFATQYDDPVLRYVAAHRVSANHYYEAPEEAVAVWDMVADDGPWWVIAQFEAARTLTNVSHRDAAADRFERLYLQAIDRGLSLPADAIVRQAFEYSSGGETRWRVFWTRYRERALRAGDAATLMTFVSLAVTSGDSDSVRRDLGIVVSRLAELELRDPAAILPIIDVMFDAGYSDHAYAALTPYLTDGASPEVLMRAATISEGRSRYGEAATYLERLLVRLEDEPMTLSDLRAIYGHLIDDLERATLTGTDRDSLVARALIAVAQWRAVDVDNPAIDRRIATMLYGVQRPNDAWRQLSSTIERHPMEGESYQVVAEVLEDEGQLERADQLWARAVAVDPTNPTWLFRRAQVSLAMGQRERANIYIRDIAARTWHDRFVNIVDQAEQLHQEGEPVAPQTE